MAIPCPNGPIGPTQLCLTDKECVHAGDTCNTLTIVALNGEAINECGPKPAGDSGTAAETGTASDAAHE
jgi:hypothetical protein